MAIACNVLEFHVIQAVTPFVRRRSSGWPIAMHVVSLADAGVLIHSPTWIDEETISRIEVMGAPRILFAPNHFHHMDLARYRERFPEGIAVASAVAIPRLRARGHDGLRPTEDVRLPPGLRWLIPEGTKSGEAWLAIDGDGGPTWIVCDAFFNEMKPVRGFEGSMLRFGKITPGAVRRRNVQVPVRSRQEAVSRVGPRCARPRKATTGPLLTRRSDSRRGRAEACRDGSCAPRVK